MTTDQAFSILLLQGLILAEVTKDSFTRHLFKFTVLTIILSEVCEELFGFNPAMALAGWLS